ncbi:multiheme c-type cytochrome [Aestuariirhabdus sp. LZHN29]|uniref:multiheme c-type cytochrome n=1 Tax=Aestuariirhabdus sp. LZHN29 TaxID=3417462 RepID=UPI003CEAC5BC
MINRYSTQLSSWSAAISALVFSAALLAAPSTTIPRSADISSTKHNLSSNFPGTDPRTVKATSESQICAFCHTPHGANLSAEGPLWNRNISNETYIKYDSSSMQANVDANPGGASKLCLSCHDGTLAIGNVNVLEGNTDVSITMSGTGAGGTVPDGEGAQSGFTRNLGTDLTNDHPISFDFDTSRTGGRLAAADGELRDPINSDGSHIQIPSPGNRPLVPLDKDGKVQCTSCHDPHISGQDLPSGTSLTASADPNNAKFLRTRRFQMSAPVGGDFDEDSDIVCLACHDKKGQTWSNSVHAANTAADQYRNWSADLREFPRNISVWQAACLNCHDTHTVEGSRRLLREGTDNIPAAQQPKQGGNPAIEETCYQCHTEDANTNALKAGTSAPNIKDEFTTKLRRMPITNSDQGVGSEVHDITNADFFEGDVELPDDSNGNVKLGYNNLGNRHVECTDCHNPHRMISNSQGDGGGTAGQGTHDHTDSTSHTNEVSGVLYGTWGVEPVYNSGSNGRKFGTVDAMPIRFTIKYGTGNDRVTAEYQICLKCHSNYGYNDDGLPESPTRPALGAPGTPSAGGTRRATTPASMAYYTNQAMEFQAPGNHQGQVSQGTDGGADLNNNNHRSWHPVMGPTGRTTSERGGASASNWLPPWDNNVGNQTMYCTDCHGANNPAADSKPPAGTPWGPHGSDNDFILRGTWPRGSVRADGDNAICSKCHDTGTYNSTGGGRTGFYGGGRGDLHSYHRNKVGSLDCMWCHVAVVHGWKNKAFLVNLRDVGPEALCRADDTGHYNLNCTQGQPVPVGTLVGRRIGGDEGQNDNEGYNNPPYYVNARLKITSFGSSGSWSASNCGGKDFMINSMCNSASY